MTIMNEAEALFGKMREATKEEQASINNYIRSISETVEPEIVDAEVMSDTETFMQDLDETILKNLGIPASFMGINVAQPVEVQVKDEPHYSETKVTSTTENASKTEMATINEVGIPKEILDMEPPPIVYDGVSSIHTFLSREDQSYLGSEIAVVVYADVKDEEVQQRLYNNIQVILRKYHVID